MCNYTAYMVIMATFVNKCFIQDPYLHYANLSKKTYPLIASQLKSFSLLGKNLFQFMPMNLKYLLMKNNMG